MLHTKLCHTAQVFTPSGTPLILEYYLLQSFFNSRPIYGIRVLSFSGNPPHPDKHCEEVVHLSYSLSFVLKLLSQCLNYLVTPTDLFSSLDTLMEQVL